jgi:hypothetical protein
LMDEIIFKINSLKTKINEMFSTVQVPKTKCKEVPKKKCKDIPVFIPRKECKHFPKTVCLKDPIQVKKTLPKKVCFSVPEQKCNKIPVEFVKHIPKTVKKKVCVSTKHKDHHGGYSSGHGGGHGGGYGHDDHGGGGGMQANVARYHLIEGGHGKEREKSCRTVSLLHFHPTPHTWQPSNDPVAIS